MAIKDALCQLSLVEIGSVVKIMMERNDEHHNNRPQNLVTSFLASTL